MPTAMLNVRMPQDLKNAGESVLRANGTNATQAIRRFYEHLKDTQEVPSWVNAQEREISNSKRALLRQIAGCAPLEPELSLDDLRVERLNKKVQVQA